MILNRWYRRPSPGGGHAHRMPVELGEYSDSGRPKVKYRFPGGQFTACSGAAWLGWARKAELMPEDYAPPGAPDTETTR